MAASASQDGCAVELFKRRTQHAMLPKNWMKQQQRIPLTAGHPHHKRQHAAHISRPAIDREASELRFLGIPQAVQAGAWAAALVDSFSRGNVPPPETVFRLSAVALNAGRPSSAPLAHSLFLQFHHLAALRWECSDPVQQLPQTSCCSRYALLRRLVQTVR